MSDPSPFITETLRFHSADGALVEGTLLRPPECSNRLVVLVHGLLVDRDEACGFYADLAVRLASIGFASFRFDLRGHGVSTTPLEHVTLCSCLTDIAAVFHHVCHRLTYDQLHLIGTSFGGGLSVLYTALTMPPLCSMVLLCPNLSFRQNWLDAKGLMSGQVLTGEAASQLARDGFLSHGSFRIGPAMLHELLQLQPYAFMKYIACPCLTIHGTADSVVPYQPSAEYYRCNDASALLLIEGADHGFSEPNDDDFIRQQTRVNQEKVFSAALDWLCRHATR